MGLRIDDPDDRTVSRRLVAFEWKRSLFSATPKDQLTRTGTDGIKCDHRRTLWVEIRIQRLHDQHLSALERLIFDRRDNGSDYTSDLHLSINEESVELLPGGGKIDLIDHADDGRIDRTIFVALSESRR